MELDLLKNWGVELVNISPRKTTNSEYVSIRGTNIPIWPNLEDLTDSNQLTRFLQKRELANKEISKLKAWIEFGVIVSDSPDSSANNEGNGFLRVQDQSMPGMLQSLNEFFGNKLCLSVKVTQICKGSDYKSPLIFSSKCLVSKDEALGAYGIYLHNLDIQNDFFNLYNRSSEYYDCGTTRSVFRGIISITVIVDDVEMSRNEKTAGDNMCITKKMLKDEIACDATIIPENGVVINCHKVFLVAHSPVLATMFTTSMTESKTSQVEIPDMTEEAVRALLEYLYYWDTKQAMEDPSICFDLFHAGHKYDIPKLEMSMKRILLSKKVEWYEVEMSLKLFLFARNLEDGQELKTKAILALKSMTGLLEESTTYQEIFTKDPKAAMELCKCAFSL